VAEEPEEVDQEAQELEGGEEEEEEEEEDNADEESLGDEDEEEEEEEEEEIMQDRSKIEVEQDENSANAMEVS
jgi:hypothetical protein